MISSLAGTGIGPNDELQDRTFLVVESNDCIEAYTEL